MKTISNYVDVFGYDLFDKDEVYLDPPIGDSFKGVFCEQGGITYLKAEDGMRIDIEELEIEDVNVIIQLRKAVTYLDKNNKKIKDGDYLFDEEFKDVFLVKKDENTGFTIKSIKGDTDDAPLELYSETTELNSFEVLLEDLNIIENPGDKAFKPKEVYEIFVHLKYEGRLEKNGSLKYNVAYKEDYMDRAITIKTTTTRATNIKIGIENFIADLYKKIPKDVKLIVVYSTQNIENDPSINIVYVKLPPTHEKLRDII